MVSCRSIDRRAILAKTNELVLRLDGFRWVQALETILLSDPRSVPLVICGTLLMLGAIFEAIFEDFAAQCWKANVDWKSLSCRCRSSFVKGI